MVGKINRNPAKIRRVCMTESVYKIIEVVGASKTDWSDAAKNAIETASKTLKDLRVAEVDKLDITVKDGKIENYRVRMKLSFKYHD